MAPAAPATIPIEALIAITHALSLSGMVKVAFPTLADADQRTIALEYFTRAWESKSIQQHLLAVAPATKKEAVQAMDKYLAVSGLDQTPQAMPVEQPDLPGQPSALEISLKTMAEAVTQQTLLLQQVLAHACYWLTRSVWAKP